MRFPVQYRVFPAPARMAQVGRWVVCEPQHVAPGARCGTEQERSGAKESAKGSMRPACSTVDNHARQRGVAGNAVEVVSTHGPRGGTGGKLQRTRGGSVLLRLCGKNYKFWPTDGLWKWETLRS